MKSFSCRSDDFCLEHGYEFMRTRMGDKIPFCEACETILCKELTVIPDELANLRGAVFPSEAITKGELRDEAAKKIHRA